MTPNNKIWFFVEGYCEQVLAEWVMRNTFYSVIRCRSESEFINSTDGNTYFITDCGNGDKIPYEINESYYKIKKASPCEIVVVCDLEKSPCHTKRKEHIIKRLDNEVDKTKIKYIFSNPTIEEIYCFERDITVDILGLPGIDLSILDNGPKSSLARMKILFQNHGQIFKKTAFAERFFPQLDYKTSENTTIKRLFNYLEHIFPELHSVLTAA